MIEPGKLPPLLTLFSFVVTFLITRFITRMIRAGRGPFRDNVSAGGTHIHHSVPGLVLLVAGAFTAVSVNTSPLTEIAAVAVGIGTSLVLDEFALILHLKDVYWSSEGRISVELVGLAAAILAFVTIGSVPFGVEAVSGQELSVRITVIISFSLNIAMVLLCMLKGKYRFALIGTFFPLTAWISALRLARPGSPWARRRYAPERMAKAELRQTRMEDRWDPRWEWLSNLVAGRPTQPAVPVQPASPTHTASPTDSDPAPPPRSEDRP
ncbi:hypothetical protein D1871_10335 [Nakamurella silvestris]|nr:hypothetical protein D1871_10335 [Nakamurella silvestris]